MFNGATNGQLFLAYGEEILLPILRPGDIVVQGNLASHKVAGRRQTIAAAGASLLYLPAYSPDLNPIEQAFAQLQALLRAKAVRTTVTLVNTIGSIVGCFAPDECRNYLRNSGCFQSG